MISITAESKIKLGFSNTIKGMVLSDRALEDFVSVDTKKLAYYLSGLELAKRLSGYGCSDELYKAITSISGETMGIEQDNTMPFTEPLQLINTFSQIDLADEAITKVINDKLNPTKITADDVKSAVNGLQSYFKYQDKRGALVKLFWC